MTIKRALPSRPRPSASQTQALRARSVASSIGTQRDPPHQRDKALNTPSGAHALQIGLLWSSAVQTLLVGEWLRDRVDPNERAALRTMVLAAKL